MEDNQEDFIVIAAGYPKEMTRFLSSNPGLPSRFEKTMYFDDYSPDDMYEIFEGMCERDRYELTDEARTAVRAHLSRIHSARNENFGNARDVRKVFKNVLSSQMRRIASLEHISDEDLSLIEATDLPAVGGAGDEDRKRAALAKLEALTGLESVKRQVTELGNLAQLNAARQKEGNRVTAPSLHTVFTGNPGTGKTTVARLIGEIYASLGILSKGHVIEVSKGDLVGEYKGHTAPKVQEAVRRAVGGVLFIDEAYSLNPSHAHSDFEREAIETLLAEMENRRADLVIIVAGYTEPMERFVESNAGLKSRFTQSVHFEDYSLDELLDIFESMSKADGYDFGVNPYSRTSSQVNF
jgi:SpoVK/Ycf46/Vps4 family AAA+-type ATPase